MKRIFPFAVLVSLTLPLATSASARTTAPTPVGSIADEAEKKFPMVAAEYRKHIAAREDRAREQLERFISKRGLLKDETDAIRARFNVALGKVDKRVEEVCTDGTVTKDEAESVHALVKDLLHTIHPEK